MTGRAIDGGPFSEVTAAEIGEELKKQGMHPFGKEVLYNGMTGTRLEAQVFMGPTFYQRLKHMVDDKYHSRNGQGPVTGLTRQPSDGRSKDGGLRYGEMEKDATTAHGAAEVMREKLHDASDRCEVWVCSQCGDFAVPPARRRANGGGRPYCTACGKHDTPRLVAMPYGTKLFFQELTALGVRPRLHLEQLVQEA